MYTCSLIPLFSIQRHDLSLVRVQGGPPFHPQARDPRQTPGSQTPTPERSHQRVNLGIRLRVTQRFHPKNAEVLRSDYERIKGCCNE